MIGQMIGLGIGFVTEGVTPTLPYQKLSLEGYVLLGSECGCDGCDCSGCLDVRIVQGNDLILALSVLDLNDTPVPMSDITGATWTLYDASNNVVMQRSLNDGGMYKDTTLNIVLEEEDTASLSGQYLHQYVLKLNNTSTATVVKNSTLELAEFYVRPSV